MASEKRDRHKENRDDEDAWATVDYIHKLDKRFLDISEEAKRVKPPADSNRNPDIDLAVKELHRLKRLAYEVNSFLTNGGEQEFVSAGNEPMRHDYMKHIKKVAGEILDATGKMKVLSGGYGLDHDTPENAYNSLIQEASRCYDLASEAPPGHNTPEYKERLRKSVERDPPKKRLLEKIAESGVSSLIFITMGLFFLSPIVTGNAVGNLTVSTSNVVGSILLIVGVILGYFYIRKK
ncbi:hypothetical protein HYW76_03720 [Candidatus Pacearchaeota archaeon]|nr:hypothetical protein [Candidatus Pacearchaeota archaeon]